MDTLPFTSLYFFIVMDNQRNELGGFLSGITYGRRARPIFCVIYGPDGVGKSTWAAQAPFPVFCGTENGTYQLDVPRLPRPETLVEFRNQLKGLQNQEHPFRTLVVDSLDWLEPLIWKKVCQDADVKTIQEYLGGYGNGFNRAAEVWRELLGEIEFVTRKMHVVLICHSKVKRFDDPNFTAGYDRYIMAINEQAAAAVRQAVDAVLFANFRVQVREVSKHVGKGIGEADRGLYTERRPAFDAKNRFGLPFELKLEWVDFAQRVKAFYSGPAQRPAQTEPAAPDPAAELSAANPAAEAPGAVPGASDVASNGEIPRTDSNASEEAAA